MSDESGSDSGGTGSDSSGGDSTVTAETIINGDGDFSISYDGIPITGEATVKIEYSKNFSEVTYARTDIWEFSNGSDAGSKGEYTITDNYITFTDADISSPNTRYRMRFKDESGTRLSQSLADSGFYPTKIEFNTADNTYSYDVVKPS